MKDINSYIQFGIYVLFVFVLYVIARFIFSTFMRKRVTSFSLDIDDDYGNDVFYSIISSFGRLLSSLVIFNGVARVYDKYVSEDSKFKSGMDYMALKIGLGLVLVFSLLCYFVLFNNSFSALLLIISFVLGFIAPDYYCYLSYSNNGKISNSQVLKAIIVMNNGFKANKGIIEVLHSGIGSSKGRMAKELKQVLNDVKMGISLDESFNRMYKRTNMAIIKELSVYLSLVHNSNVNIVKIFDLIEDRLIKEEEFNSKLYNYDLFSYLLYLIGVLLPVLIVSIVFIVDHSYVSVLLSSNGYLLVSLYVVGYLVYLFIFGLLYKGGKL